MKTLTQVIKKLAFEAAIAEYHEAMSGCLFTCVEPKDVGLASYAYSVDYDKLDKIIYKRAIKINRKIWQYNSISEAQVTSYIAKEKSCF